MTAILLALRRWWSERVCYISWHKHWKGVYLHFLHPTRCVRVYLWGVDWHRKPKVEGR